MKGEYFYTYENTYPSGGVSKGYGTVEVSEEKAGVVVKKVEEGIRAEFPDVSYVVITSMSKL